MYCFFFTILLFALSSSLQAAPSNITLPYQIDSSNPVEAPVVFQSTVSRDKPLSLILTVDVLNFFPVVFLNDSSMLISVYSLDGEQTLVAGPNYALAFEAEPIYCPLSQTIDGVALCRFNLSITSISSQITAVQISGYLVQYFSLIDDSLINFSITSGQSKFVGANFLYQSFTKTVVFLPETDSEMKLFIYTAESPLMVRERIDTWSDSTKIVQVNPSAGLSIFQLVAKDQVIPRNVSFKVSVTTIFSNTVSISSSPAIYATLGAASILIAVSVMFLICIVAMVISSFVLFFHPQKLLCILNISFLQRHRNRVADDQGLFGIRHPSIDLDQIAVQKVEDKEFSTKDDAKCVICLEDYALGEDLRVLQCGHHFHKVCADEWLSEKPTCP